MHQSLLDILRCPFCGTRLSLVENDALMRNGDTIESGVLGCECCAFPIVAGIPVLIADDPTREAMHALEAGRRDDALAMLLGLDAPRTRAFAALAADPSALTYQKAVEILSPDAEGTYFVYRFSDPTYVMAQTLLEGITTNAWTIEGRVLDLCGGSGHLTRVLAQARPRGGAMLADVFFWKLWLATRIVAPDCTAICCDGNNPLPFARDTFSMVVLSDAFPYIWHKRLLADEMMRIAGETGIVVMPHLHSTLGENFSAGMTLTPAAYRDLFAPLEPRLFPDSLLLTDAIDRGALDLSAPVDADWLDGEPSLTLVATHRADVFRRYEPVRPSADGQLAVNPLYRVNEKGSDLELTLAYPTPEYEEEFGESKRYLAASLTLQKPVTRETLGAGYEALRRRRILLDVPPRYV